jgi:hypothetical protein
MENLVQRNKLLKKVKELDNQNSIYQLSFDKLNEEITKIVNIQTEKYNKLDTEITNWFEQNLLINNRIEFVNCTIYIYMKDGSYGSVTLRINSENLLNINWFSTSCNSNDKYYIDYLILLGKIAENVKLIETQFLIWNEKNNEIRNLSKEKNLLLYQINSQITENLKQIAKIYKKIN